MERVQPVAVDPDSDSARLVVADLSSDLGPGADSVVVLLRFPLLFQLLRLVKSESVDEANVHPLDCERYEEVSQPKWVSKVWARWTDTAWTLIWLPGFAGVNGASRGGGKHEE